MMTSKDAMKTWRILSQPRLKSCTNCVRTNSVNGYHDCDRNIRDICSAPHRIHFSGKQEGMSNYWEWSGREMTEKEMTGWGEDQYDAYEWTFYDDK